MKKLFFILFSISIILSNLSCAPIQSGPIAVTVKLKWTCVGDDGNSGTASHYDLRYSTSTISDANFNALTNKIAESTMPIPKIAGTKDSVILSLTLQSSTTYYFAMKVGDEVINWSTVSNNATITTPDIDSPAAVTDLTGTIQ